MDISVFGVSGSPVKNGNVETFMRSMLDEAGRRGAAAGRRRALRVLSLSGVALASGWAVRETTPWQRLLADASTSVGEQRTLRLADGSVVMLNTDSAISSDFMRVSRCSSSPMCCTTASCRCRAWRSPVARQLRT